LASTWRETLDHAAGDAFTAPEPQAILVALSPTTRALLVWQIEDRERFGEIADRLECTGGRCVADGVNCGRRCVVECSCSNGGMEMTDLTRTIRQWWATARRLEHRVIGRPDLARKIHWAFPSDPNADPDTPVTVSFLTADAGVIERRAPLTAWWMPASPGRGVQPSDWGRPRHSPAAPAEDVVAAAEAIIRDHQRRQG